MPPSYNFFGILTIFSLKSPQEPERVRETGIRSRLWDLVREVWGVEELSLMSDDRPSLPPGYHDPRMRGFRARSAVSVVVALIEGRIGRLGPEEIDFRDGAGRVLAQEVGAIEPVPAFDRAAMDGYAVRGEETI